VCPADRSRLKSYLRPKRGLKQNRSTVAFDELATMICSGGRLEFQHAVRTMQRCPRELTRGSSELVDLGRVGNVLVPIDDRDRVESGSRLPRRSAAAGRDQPRRC
jgi:hypothetical protein